MTVLLVVRQGVRWCQAHDTQPKNPRAQHGASADSLRSAVAGGL